ncbi:hypothetical protein RSAG8_05618, partial [Rhizoctonia solani AG-8 WAC10335]
MKNPSERHKPDVYVDSIRDTFANYSTILQNGVFGRTNHPLFQGLLDNIINYDIIDLVARAMLMLELPSEPPAPALAGSADYLPRIKHFYGQLCVSVPKQYIYIISDHCLPEWLKFRSYLTWYPEIRRLVPEDRHHIKKCLGAIMQDATIHSGWMASISLAPFVIVAHTVARCVKHVWRLESSTCRLVRGGEGSGEISAIGMIVSSFPLSTPERHTYDPRHLGFINYPSPNQVVRNYMYQFKSAL